MPSSTNDSSEADTRPVLVHGATGGQNSFYKRTLPPTCIDFSSPDGKALFLCALQEGHLENYFILASQFTTQSEPAFCGLATLCMVLNAFGIDPKKQWKGPWRWYDDSMLDCCQPLEEVRKSGLTLGEFGCLARCNGLAAEIYRPDKRPLDCFRADVVAATASADTMICVCFHRPTLGQTGEGHFSPIGGYCAARDMVLILDVARFKYPPYWLPLQSLYAATAPEDPRIKRPRGYAVLRRGHGCLAVLPKLSLTAANASLLLDRVAIECKERFSGIDLSTLTLSTLLTQLVSCIPAELSTVIVERFGTMTVSHARPKQEAHEAHETHEHSATNGPIDFGKDDPCNCNGIGGEFCRSAAATLEAFRDQYTMQLNQLVHLVHNTSLCKTLLPLIHDALDEGKAEWLFPRFGSDAATQILKRRNSANAPPTRSTHLEPAAPLIGSNNIEQERNGTSTNATRPPTDAGSAGTSSGFHGSENDLTGPHKLCIVPRVPAFLTLLMLTLSLDDVVPVPQLRHQNMPLYEQLVDLWDLETHPLFLRNEVTILRCQMQALRRVWSDEQCPASHRLITNCNMHTQNDLI